MINVVFKVLVLFFDINLVGCILNCFFKDVGCMDDLFLGKFFFVI